MKVKLSSRETVMVILAGLALLFLVFWYLLLNPLLIRRDISRQEIAGAQGQLTKLRQAPLQKPAAPPKFKVFNREEQTTLLMTFINNHFQWLDIRLISLTQSVDKNIITIDLQGIFTYKQLLSFINSLHKTETLLVIDQVNVSQQADKLNVSFRLKSGHL